MRPTWLPDEIETDGEWHQVLERLYAVFCRGLKDRRLCLNGLPVSWDSRISGDGLEEGFWHLITHLDQQTGDRVFEPERARKLPWCGVTVEHASDPAVLQWRYWERRALRTYLWVQAEDYVVVLEETPPRRPRRYVLITAFHLSGDSQRRNMQRRYENREP